MSTENTTPLRITIRAVGPDDVDAVARIDAAYTGDRHQEWWMQTISRHLTPARKGSERVGLVAVDDQGEVVGYLLGQVRAFEFGSAPCGWIYAIGIAPELRHHRVASSLFRVARKAFRDLNIRLVRTMVRRDDVPVLTFFRNMGFVAGPYVELELALEETSDG